MKPSMPDLCRATSAAGRCVGGSAERLRGNERRMSTGHYRLPDGSLVRVDVERDHWVGRLYTPELILKVQFLGTDTQVHTWLNAVAARHAAGSNK